MTKLDALNLLGLQIDEKLDEAVIKKSFKQQAIKYHPDVNKNADANNKFNNITIAKDFLLNSLNEKTVISNNQFNYNGHDFADFFSAYDKLKNQVKNNDFVQRKIQLHLSFLETIFGCKKQIMFSRFIACPDCQVFNAKKCQTCNDSKIIVENKKVTVTVPPSNGNSVLLKLSKCGDVVNAKLSNQYYQDIFVSVIPQIVEDENLYIKNNIIYTHKTLTLKEFLLGGDVEIITFDFKTSQQITIKYNLSINELNRGYIIMPLKNSPVFLTQKVVLSYIRNEQEIKKEIQNLITDHNNYSK